MPTIWDGFDIHQVADAVHDEFPGVHHIALIKEFLAQGATVNRTMVPSPSKHDFVRGVVMLSDITGFAIRTVGPLNFGTKWWVGRARPEEVAWMIYNDELTSEDGVPSDIVTDIKSMQLSSPFDFTAYPEGSPTHPSWPAMHSAASSASLWLALVLNLTKEQYCEVRKVDYAISYARTVAGVHFPSDNISGLNLGQEILSHYLPKYLSETYEADANDVKERIQSLRFDWHDFMSSECLEDFVVPS
jgi:membrane-associated phospholipid phosphatase